MAEHIQVTCPKCNRGIRAPRGAAGRWGKCPNCQGRVYVPMPDDELEDIPLAPLDDEADRLEAEARELQAQILREKEDAADAPGTPATGPTAGSAAPAVQVSDAIIAYLVAMKDSDLAGAERIVRQLASVKSKAKSRVAQLMVDAMPPPKLGDMPPPLYMGFLKKLDEALG